MVGGVLFCVLLDCGSGSILEHGGSAGFGYVSTTTISLTVVVVGGSGGGRGFWVLELLIALTVVVVSWYLVLVSWHLVLMQWCLDLALVYG
ncbi:hypothetical protein TSUD_95090 [Trifolium subterraneum]|uniref:Transmembrane protein n=1 Tax=Trifolium subterraneum TaxID=3900 RepID=A0A2Z6LPK6_TRISU|nr:hypothetical protein TSUD_95090 [Trifolium subterraneum]